MTMTNGLSEDVETEPTNELKKNLTEFEKEFTNEHSIDEKTTTDKEGISTDIKPTNELSIEKINSYNALLSHIPRDLLLPCLSPASFISYKTLSKDIDKDTANEIKAYYELTNEQIEKRKILIAEMLAELFPDLKIGTELKAWQQFAIAESLVIFTAHSNAKNHIAEKRSLENKEPINEVA